MRSYNYLVRYKSSFNADHPLTDSSVRHKPIRRQPRMRTRFQDIVSQQLINDHSSLDSHQKVEISSLQPPSEIQAIHSFMTCYHTACGSKQDRSIACHLVPGSYAWELRLLNVCADHLSNIHASYRSRYSFLDMADGNGQLGDEF